MARRRIGQEQLWSERAARPGGATLDEVAALIDWAVLDQLLTGISASAKVSLAGRPWRCFERNWSLPGMTYPTCAWPKRLATVPAFAGSAASQRTRRRRSEPPLSASVVNWCGWGSTVRYSRPSSVSSTLANRLHPGTVT